MSIQVKGLDSVLKNLSKQTEAIKRRVDETMTEGAEKIEERAKLLAPVDRGLMRGEIVADTSIPFNKRVTDNTFYAPYVEFGTGRRFDANGRENIASQFKGKRGNGNFEDFVKNIGDWLKRKGYYPPEARTAQQKYSYAKFIASRILRNGIKPQPFFFRAYDEVLPTIIQDLQKIVK